MSLAFRSSTAGWYAEWKARKTAVAEQPQLPADAPAATPNDDAAAAVARWLTGGN